MTYRTESLERNEPVFITAFILELLNEVKNILILYLADIGPISEINVSGLAYLGPRVSEEAAPLPGGEDEEQELTDVAQSALPTVGTEALVGVESVDAGPSVATGVAGTVIDVLGGGTTC